MTVSERPEPAVRRPRLHQDVGKAYRSFDVVTTNSREVECQACWNRTVQLHIEIRRDWLVRGALAVAVLCALVCAWVAWDARADRVSAQNHHRRFTEER